VFQFPISNFQFPISNFQFPNSKFQFPIPASSLSAPNCGSGRRARTLPPLPRSMANLFTSRRCLSSTR
jgi:hypothetical protein